MGCGNHSKMTLEDGLFNKDYRNHRRHSVTLNANNHKYEIAPDILQNLNNQAQDFILDDNMKETNLIKNGKTGNSHHFQGKTNQANLHHVNSQNHNNVNFINKLNKENKFFIKQYVIGCLSQYSYYVESKGECLIIDPIRDIDIYLEFIKLRKSKLKYVLETHFHADFVSGHIELAEKLGCKIIYGPSAAIQTKFEIYEAKDNEEIKFGECRIKVIHTPGHTLESSCFLLSNENNIQKALFSGDTVFLGEVGRPDLAINLLHKVSGSYLAEKLFDSIQKVKALDENLIILPGHGPGSLCGRKIENGFCDILKNQLKTNKALDDRLTKEVFVETLLKELPHPPSYYTTSMSLNILGHEVLDKIIERSMQQYSPEEFDKIISSHKVAVVDTRNHLLACEGIIKGSVLIPLNITYAVWTATLYDADTKFILVCEKGKEKESIVRLARVGYHNILGYLGVSVKEYEFYDSNCIAKIPFKTEKEVLEIIENDEMEIIDVREVTEIINTGYIKNARIFPLSELLSYLDQISEFTKPIGVYCKVGSRAAVAASIMIKYNYTNVHNLGGFDSLKFAGVEIVQLGG